MAGFVLREDGNGNRFYDHELTEVMNPDDLTETSDPDRQIPGHPANEGPSAEGAHEHRTDQGTDPDWQIPGKQHQEVAEHRTNRGMCEFTARQVLCQ